jgi:Fe2+ transport system protein FeoA
MKKASDLNSDEKGIIKDISTHNSHHCRLIEIGFTPGQEIKLVSTSLFKDPLTFSLRGTLISIRKKQAEYIILD